MSSDEYVDIEMDADVARAKTASPKPKVVAISNAGSSNGYLEHASVEIVDATSYQRPDNLADITAEDANCLICEGPANGVHFRAQSCAACNAFFRRSVAEKRRYICREKGSCDIHYKQRCLCRACRLKKCLAVGMDPGAVQPQRDSIGSKKTTSSFRKTRHTKVAEKDKETPVVQPTEVQTVIKSTQAAECDVSSVSSCSYDVGSYQYSANTESDSKEYEEGAIIIECGNLIEEVLCSFQQLQERRRLLYCPRTLRDLLSGTLPTFRKEGHFFMKEDFKAEVANIIEFLRGIQPFLVFDLDNQLALVRNFCLPMTIIEKYYTTYRQGGHLTSCIYHQNYTYRDLNEVQTDPEFKEGTHNINHQTMFEINIPYLKKAINDICLPMAAVEMTDVEVVGLMLIMLFDPNAPNLAEQSKKIVKAIRDRVCEDWFAIYNHNGIKDGPEKVGNVVLITSAIDEFAKLIPQNFHFLRVFGLHDYDELLNDVFLKEK